MQVWLKMAPVSLLLRHHWYWWATHVSNPSIMAWSGGGHAQVSGTYRIEEGKINCARFRVTALSPTCPCTFFTGDLALSCQLALALGTCNMTVVLNEEILPVTRHHKIHHYSTVS